MDTTTELLTAEELYHFLNGTEEILKDVDFDHRITIEKSIFDFSFSGLENIWKRRLLRNISGDYLHFKQCIFIGQLEFNECSFESIRFENCQFLRPENYQRNQWESLKLSDVKARWITIEKSFLDSPVDVYQGTIDELQFSYLTCPIVWLQAMRNQGTTLIINRFLGDSIHLPDEGEFKKIDVDYFSLPLINGSTRNAHVYFTKK